MANGLISHGCRNSKSLNIEMPDLTSKELYRHFIRGFFDGDGHINRRQEFIGIEFTCASKSFILSLMAYAIDIANIKLTAKKDPRSNAYKLVSTSRWEAVRFIQHLYDNSSVYLHRKYEQYLSICRSETISLKSLSNEDGIKRGWRKVS